MTDMQNKDRSSEEYAAAILCGGKSIRMGQDKATMRLGGVRLADRLIREFAPCGEVLLSVRDDAQAEQIRRGFPEERDGAAGSWVPEELRFVRDEIRDRGPLAGIAASLKHCRRDWLFVTAVDLPYMDKAFADGLLQAGRDPAGLPAQSAAGLADLPAFDVIVPCDEKGRQQGLSAFYSKRSLPYIEACLLSGSGRVRTCLETMRVLQIPAGRLENGMGKLQNMNTAADIPADLPEEPGCRKL